MIEEEFLNEVEELVSNFIKKTSGIPGRIYEYKKTSGITYARVRNSGDGRELWRMRGKYVKPFECSVEKYKTLSEFIKKAVIEEDY